MAKRASKSTGPGRIPEPAKVDAEISEGAREPAGGWRPWGKNRPVCRIYYGYRYGVGRIREDGTSTDGRLAYEIRRDYEDKISGQKHIHAISERGQIPDWKQLADLLQRVRVMGCNAEDGTLLLEMTEEELSMVTQRQDSGMRRIADQLERMEPYGPAQVARLSRAGR